jgi:ribosomal protein S18 acetylase RimI-like enzyme
MSLQLRETTDPSLVEQFISVAGTSLESFRYFEKRPFSIVLNHIVTYLVVDEAEKLVGYGHLDTESDKIWLGIAIAEHCKGKGIGNLLMSHLIEAAKKNKISTLYLSVEVGNKVAIHLFEKKGFIFENKFSDRVQIMKCFLDEVIC